MDHAKLRCLRLCCVLTALASYREAAEGFSARPSTGNPRAAASPPHSSPSCLFSENGDATGDEKASGGSKWDDFDVDAVFQRASKISQPTKADLYGDDELAGLLSMHRQLQSAMAPPTPDPPSDPEPDLEQTEEPADPLAGGLHELVLQTVGDTGGGPSDDAEASAPPSSGGLQDLIRNTVAQIEEETAGAEPVAEPASPLADGLHDLILETVGELDAGPSDPGASPPTESLQDLVRETVAEIEEEANKPPPPEWIPEGVRDKLSELTIVAVASDVDGTIIGADQTIHPRTVRSINAALESPGLDWVFPATGKTRWGAANSMGPELASFTRGPGVYNQGLYCLGRDGEVVFEKKLTTPALEAAERLVADAGAAVVAYDGDDLYTTDGTKTEVVELHEKWGEPASREIPSLVGHSPGVHKILVMDNDAEKLASEVRPELEKVARETGSVVTQAIPTMLELLPAGCSKAVGVQKLCEHLGIDPGTQLLTMGDAENDVGMLEISAIGVAVGNAGRDAKDAADIILPITSTDGGVGMALNDILGV